MKKLIALILISLLIPIPSASANGSSYQLVTPVLTTTYELPAQSRDSRWDTIKIPFSVILTSDGTVASFAFVLIDAEGYELSTRYFNAFNAYFSPQTWTQNDEWKLYQFDKAKLPIRLKTEIRYWSTTAKPTITQTFPMNFTIHKDDVAEKAQTDAVARAQAEAVAKAQAEAQRVLAEAKAIADAKAKAEADAKAKAEADAKAKAEAEAKAILDAKAKAEADVKAKAEADRLVAEAKEKAEAEAKADLIAKVYADAKAKADAEAKAFADAMARAVEYQKYMNSAEKLKRDNQFFQSLVNETTCKKLGSTKLAGGKVFTCKKINKKLIWK